MYGKIDIIRPAIMFKSCHWSGHGTSAAVSRLNCRPNYGDVDFAAETFLPRYATQSAVMPRYAVCPSVCPSVTFRYRHYRDHIGWKLEILRK